MLIIGHFQLLYIDITDTTERQSIFLITNWNNNNNNNLVLLNLVSKVNAKHENIIENF
jgi:hypothetical protein